MLELAGIDTFRGRAQILRQVSLSVGEKESVVLVGRNGAGKTTTIDSIIGLLPLRSGKLTFQGKDISSLPAYKRARLGIGYAPEDSGLFPDLTVAENFQICRWLAQSSGRAAQAAETDERVFALFPEVRELLNRQGLTAFGLPYELIYASVRRDNLEAVIPLTTTTKAQGQKRPPPHSWPKDSHAAANWESLHWADKNSFFFSLFRPRRRARSLRIAHKVAPSLTVFPFFKIYIYIYISGAEER